MINHRLGWKIFYNLKLIQQNILYYLYSVIKRPNIPESFANDISPSTDN
jgi:hypothetical protein